MDIVSPISYVATILLACESFILLLIPAVIIGGSMYGARWLRFKLPPVFIQIRKYVAMFKFYVERGCASIVAPLIAAHALAAQVRAIARGLGFLRGEN
jgi:hypothetical protein